MNSDKIGNSNGAASLKFYNHLHHKKVLNLQKSDMKDKLTSHLQKQDTRRRVLMVHSIDKKIKRLDEIDKHNSLIYEKLRRVKASVPRVVVIQPSQ